jgi:Proprotein convertase P-domain
MAIRRTSAPPRPPSPSRASTATGSSEATAAPAQSRPSPRRRNSSVFETGPLPRAALDGTRARATAGAAPSDPSTVSVRATPNLAIPDRSSITTSLTVGEDVKLDKLALDLDIAHPYRGDLKVTLTSPSGTSAVVHNGTGAGADDLKGTFDLSAFAGESAKGEWKLTVQDRLGGDVGTLKAWGLTSNPSAPPRPTSNGFVTKLGGHYPPVAAGGILTQLKQAAATAQLALSAAASVASGGRAPPDFAVASKLRSLSVASLTDDSDKVTQSDYFSQLAGVKPEQAYEYFVNNPGAIFGSADVKVRPATAKLQDGQRLMLEQAGSPSVWFPIEVRLDPAKKQINIATLDGHPLRGTNQFTFADDGQGGTRVNQLTRFQLTSKAVELGMGADDLQRQHSTWEQAHKTLFEHFNPRS